MISTSQFTRSTLICSLALSLYSLSSYAACPELYSDKIADQGHTSKRVIETGNGGEVKKNWLSGFLSLPNGIPSHDTFNNVISRLEPSVFAECCLGWMKEAAAKIGAQIISIDGKSFNGSYDREKGQKSLHMVST